MHGEEEYMIQRTQAQQLSPDQGRLFEVERQLRLSPRQPHGFCFPFFLPSYRSQIQQRKSNVDLVFDDLLRLTLYGDETSAQGFMLARNLLQGPLQYFYIQLPSNPQRAGDVVGCFSGSELIDKPQASLGKRSRKTNNFLGRWLEEIRSG